MYEMLMGNAPFSGKNDNETFEKIAHHDLNKDSTYESLSTPAKDLISKILVPESDKRMVYEDILNHPWFVDFDEEHKDEENVEPNTKNHKMKTSSNLVNNSSPNVTANENKSHIAKYSNS